MIANKKEFYGGMGLMGGFIVVFVILFLPVFNGHNALNYMDQLYNSISKGSAYYVPELKIEAAKELNKNISVTLKMKDEKQAKETVQILLGAGAQVAMSGAELKMTGDLGKILTSVLDDTDLMFYNKGNELQAKYNMDERQAFFNWYTVMKALDKDLTHQKKFAEAKVVATIIKKGVECAYNYYKVEPQKIGDKAGIVIFSLVFYVVYTLWYGFAILFMFEGWGLRLEH
ncbi:MAG: hypothetical protein AB7S77_05795 [Desulfatirhabdiaceae bacterium]